jgi:hypothetical protein
MNITIRTRKVKPTDTLGSRIRVEVVAGSGKGLSRTLAYNYAATNAHDGAAIEFLHALGFDNFRFDLKSETRSGRGNRYAVTIL